VATNIFFSFITFCDFLCKGKHIFKLLLNTPNHNLAKLLTAAALLFITAFVAYWQVISFSNCLKWDMVDQYFPWRYHVVGCLRNGELPLWNPYNFAGYPIHADPQSGAWYMPLWLFALFGNYGPYANAVEVFLHIWLAGLGMYMLVSYLYKNHWVALIAGASYIGCGLLVGNVQHFTYIISTCWLPYVLLYFIRTLQSGGLKNPLALALFLWLFFTGGYPAFFIITAYILGIAYVIYLLRHRQNYRALLLRGSLAALVFILLASPSLVSFALYWNDTTRSGGLSLADAMFGAFRVNDVQSFFNPMLSVVKKVDTGTDVSMMNGYFGLVPLVFLIFLMPFYKRLSKTEVFILATTIICLLAAFGNTFILPVREWLFHLPGLNIFRFPAIFRLFAIVGFILTASFVMKLYEERGEKNGDWKWLLGSLGFVALVIVALSAKNTIWGSVASDFKAFRFIWSDMPGSSAAAILGGGLQLAFLALVFIFRNNLKALAFLAIANSIVFVQLNIGTTVINKESPQVIAQFLATMPQGFTIDNNRAMDNTQFTASAPLWRNLGIFYKQSSYDGNNPFRLKNFADFESLDTAKNYAGMPMFFIKKSKLNFINTPRNNLLEIEIASTEPDTLIIFHNMASNWDIKFDLMADAKNTLMSVVSGVASKEYKIKGGLITKVPVFEGKPIIRLKYKPPYVFEFFIVSVVILLLSLGAIVWYKP
jgi:hypothetical protein